MTTARDLLLSRVLAALTDVPDTERPDDVDVPRDYLAHHADGDLVEIFTERVTDYGARVVRVGPEELPHTIAELLHSRGVREVVVPPGFPAAALTSISVDAIVADEPRLETARLAAVDGVVTTAAAVVAVTGTVVLDSGPGQGRRALSLLPDYHLCVVRADQIVADVPDALRLIDPTRPLTFVSGPSATSDIENNRVEGVHGPRTFDVAIVTDGT
jgi:L-lactate dehydrogenase complex protein LldG